LQGSIPFQRRQATRCAADSIEVRDRRLNQALHTVALNRMTYDTETNVYVAKRQAEGRTTKKIRRCVKRYLDRRVYRTLSVTGPVLIPACQT